MSIFFCASNSYWLGEDIPCLTYGLRGVIHSTLTITSKNVDLHSGVDGGAVSEPLIDMVKVLSELVNPDRTAKIPGTAHTLSPLSSFVCFFLREKKYHSSDLMIFFFAIQDSTIAFGH